MISPARLCITFIFLLIIFTNPVYCQWVKHYVDQNLEGAYGLYVADISGDSLLDIVATGLVGGSDCVVWYEAPHWTRHFIDQNLVEYANVCAADIDGDNDIDVLAADFDADLIILYEAPSWTRHIISSNGINPDGAIDMCVGDMDGDTDLDVVAIGWYGWVYWYEAPAWTEHLVAWDIGGAYDVKVADMDNDTDLDIIATGHWGQLNWYENNLPSWNWHSINTLGGARSLDVVDLDGDNSLDVIAAAFYTNRIYRFESPSWNQDTIAQLYRADGVFAADMNNDDTLDVVATGRDSVGHVVWYEGPDWTAHFIDQNLPGARGLYVADMNNDGLLGVVATGMFANQVVLYERYNTTSIASILPIQNALNVPVNLNISVTFNRDMDETSLNDSTFVVNARCTGLHHGTISYNSQTRTATFDPDEDFDEGEVVTVVLTSGIKCSQGFPICSKVWSFTVEVGDGSGNGFAPHTVYQTGDSTFSVFAADLDKDGDLDLTTANLASNDVSVLFNNGDGTFASHSVYPVGNNPKSIFAADLDRDGDMDLTTANPGSHNVSVLLNNGDGTFAPHSDYTVGGSGPSSVFSADLDGDGDLDLATSANTSAKILLNNGDGTFGPYTQYNMGPSAYSIFASDLDTDGDFDLAIANINPPHEISVLLNNGDGSFGPETKYTVSDRPCSIFAADLDADGDLDLSTSSWASNNISVLLNNGNGTFAPHIPYPVGHHSDAIFAADLNGDFHLDLAIANSWFQTYQDISVLLNNGNGTFAPYTAYPVGYNPKSVFAADLDNDGDLDLASANSGSDNVSVLINQDIVGIEESEEIIPKKFYLYQNYPNPFNPSTTIEFDLPKASEVKLKIFNILGEEVSTLVSDRLSAGSYSYEWDASNFASGVYLYRLQAGDYNETRKMVLMS
jgi:hypothetical protein